MNDNIYDDDKKKMSSFAAISMLIVLTAAVLCICFAPFGLKNPETPAGHEGYVVSRPIIFGSGGYTKTLVGPRKHGLCWRRYITNIDVRPQAKIETFKIRMNDNLNVAFNIALKISPTPGETKELIETLSEAWYVRYIQPEFRTVSRKVIAQYDSEGITQKRDVLAAEIRAEMEKVVADKPLTIHSIVVGNVDYPAVVDQEIELKLAARQELAKKATQLEIKKQEAEIRVAEAEGIARAQEIINATLTTAYLQHEAIGAAKELAQSDNTTFYFIPTSTTGMGMPLVLSTPTPPPTPSRLANGNGALKKGVGNGRN